MEARLKIYHKTFYGIAFLVLSAGIAHVAEQLQFYYFNPDSIQSNLRQLKSHMDTVLQKNEIQASFQPFAHLSDLDNQIRKNQPTLLYVPYWYFERYGNELGLQPLLTSWRNDKPDYQKKLITNILPRQNFGHQISKTLAMTTMGPDNTSILNRLTYYNDTNKTGQYNIIEVPKDADAVFAVALGQVDSALVSSSILQLLEKRNPKLISSIQIIAETQPINLPVLCYLKGTIKDKQLEMLRQQFQKDASMEGRNIPKILGIDTWRLGI